MIILRIRDHVKHYASEMKKVKILPSLIDFYYFVHHKLLALCLLFLFETSTPILIWKLFTFVHSRLSLIQKSANIFFSNSIKNDEIRIEFEIRCV